jgi:tRNA(Arg) A34 adenosine deaminase TadA
MTNEVKPLAKSLHTVSVLVNLSKYLMQSGDPAVHSEFTAVEKACVTLRALRSSN